RVPLMLPSPVLVVDSMGTGIMPGSGVFDQSTCDMRTMWGGPVARVSYSEGIKGPATLPAVGATLIGANLRLDGAANSSPPPCGEGSGVGVGRCGTSVPHGTPPHPNPPPQRGRESARLS